MGKVMDNVVFGDGAPSAEEVAALASRMCGLEICVEQQTPGEFLAYDSKLYFHGFGKHTVRLYMPRHRADFIKGDEVCIEAAAEGDLTLCWILMRVLHELGGEVHQGFLPNESELCGLTSLEMRKRYDLARKRRLKIMPMHLLSVLWIFVCTPFCLLWILLKLPWKIYKLRNGDWRAS